MSIHISHSRKDLLEICDIFTIKIEDKFDLSKKDLGEAMWTVLNGMREIDPDEQYYFIENKEELLEYLTNPHQTKSLSIQDKQEVIKYARHIIFYCENGYNFFPHFEDLNHLKQVAIYISNYGDISTVRRALLSLKLDKKIKPTIVPTISKRVLKELEKSELLKKDCMNILRVRPGPITVVFDD